ncbi:MAG: NAD(P)/FAD-dependent oxidoreductase [Formosimonas sp.]
MLRINELRVPLIKEYEKNLPEHHLADFQEDKLNQQLRDQLQAAILKRLNITAAELLNFKVFKRSYDARKVREILLSYSVDVTLADEAQVLQRFSDDRHVLVSPDTSYHFVARVDAFPAGRERPIVVGFGPCGLFAALLLAQMGLKPIVVERGREVRQRTKDTWGLWRKRELNPDSNVQFGEGGAGTFSDGKLYSQIKDPKFYGRKVIEEFVKAGAPEEILFINKPHIGTFRLVGVIERMRAEIIALGGEVRFESRVVDILLDDGAIHGVQLADGTVLRSQHVVLALGHSARDTVQMLHERGVFMEAKPFSVGFRVEHPQSIIDKARFGDYAGHPVLGAADYKLVHHASNGRSVYSFCMCPGGTVVAATSEPNRVVTNGMSQYSRNERNANSGIVVGVDARDFPDASPLAGIEFQRFWESRAFELGGGDYSAPAQLLGDFVANRPSVAVGTVEPSYKPSVKWGDLNPSLPDYVIDAVREALPAFDKQIRGYKLHDAVITGVETRTSSPVRITRNRETLQSLNVKGLYPAGEGAGYAGGILSAGVDGIHVAEAIARDLLGQ